MNEQKNIGELKIVIPTEKRKGLDGKVADHFGRCLTYTFVSESGDLIKVIDNTSEHMGGKGLPPELMKKNGADVLLCRDLGPRAIDLCQKMGIEIYVGEAETVEDMFQLWKDKKLKRAGAEDACKTHKS